MNFLNRLTHILLAVAVTVSAAQAQAPEGLQELVLEGNLFGRSTLDFRKNAKNIQFMVPEGSQGQVLETIRLSRTGSYGVRVKLTKVNGKPDQKGIPKEGDETWLYFSQKDPWLTFKDKDGTEVQDPEVALVSQARRDGSGLPTETGAAANVHLPTRQEVIAQQKPEPKKEDDPNLPKSTDPKKTEAGLCATCAAEQNPESVRRNRADIEAVKKGMEQIPKAVPPDSKWSNYPAVAKYSASKDVEASIKYGMRNKERRSKKLCYRYVKRAALGGGLVDDYPPGRKAVNAVSDFKRRGFINMMEDPRYKNLIKNPQDAPKGAILVYRNTLDRKHPGHAEIKTDWGSDGGYVSDFYRKTSQPLRNRELIGVMIKETK